ncbi:MAG: hypothetical protein COT34_01260 [Candidatus Nealsonbacteria bacterium CG08_land_8_20_14_0_20_43_11]|uniref:Glycosyltransferase 2-like domain-containing protein n=1 Tax=Candidatus Nealsonbacteria bacterium CG08_land_8_20_14_0_20_43_11 TaxID=1974706 RepID=A0A2M6T0P8_9BACT|nr:MAG: hypothetical protein COT34_01260 [Candidatus Nealsonbacteria bacterium CG08_land_8_20_14_0_20_43_11]
MENQKLEFKLPPVSVVIPAYNEEKCVKAAIDSILKSGFPCELVVVDDGSTDKTPEVLRDFGLQIRVFTHEKNRGKAAAMATGVKNAREEIIVFTDADIIGLNRFHLLMLTLPLIEKESDAVIGVLTEERPSLTEIGPSFWWLVSGLRAYYKNDLLPLIPRFEKLGYGIEIFLYRRFRKKKTLVMPLSGLSHPLKADKLSLEKASFHYLKEGTEIFKAAAEAGGLSPNEKNKLLLLFRKYARIGRQKTAKYLKLSKKILTKTINQQK